jgi:GNAT superfamily N-acetyltransferase
MLTAHVESLTDRLEELKPFFPMHWEELALNQKQVPLDPQYETYLQRDALGEIMAIVLRKNGDIVGYFVGFVAPGLHYRTCLTLTMDIFYVLPEHRGDGGGFVLFKAVEAEAKRRGVQRMFVGSKMHKDASWLFEKLGYEPVEVYYSLWMGEA